MYSSTCFGRPHAHHQELNNCSSSHWFYRWSVAVAVLLVAFFYCIAVIPGFLRYIFVENLASYRHFTVTGFEELYCECGSSVLYPPVPCGTRRPECSKPCSRPHSCEHPTLHPCHSQPVCPPCTVLTQKYCYGKHEVRCYPVCKYSFAELIVSSTQVSYFLWPTIPPSV